MIVLERVCKSYDGGAYTVRDVSFRVPQGQLLVLLGGCVVCLGLLGFENAYGNLAGSKLFPYIRDDTLVMR